MTDKQLYLFKCTPFIYARCYGYAKMFSTRLLSKHDFMKRTVV